MGLRVFPMYGRFFSFPQVSERCMVKASPTFLSVHIILFAFRKEMGLDGILFFISRIFASVFSPAVPDTCRQLLVILIASVS